MSFLTRVVLTLSLLVASSAFAGWKQNGPGSSSFDAKGPAGFKIHGETKKTTVTDDGTDVKVSIALADVDTDNSLRNKHLLEDMHADKFPNITLSVPAASLKTPAEGSSTEGQANGTFNIHGQTKTVPFKYVATNVAGTVKVDGSADVNLSDFGVKIRSYLGITVKPDIVVGAKFELKK
jgi:polyisoprenoid-binding protein YceI